MKTFTIAAVALGILAAATASAQAQPIEDEAATNLTARTLKRCLAAYDWDKKAYKPDEISEYCSCYAVTLINMTTQEEYDIATATGKWPDDGKQKQESHKYCTKYLNLPDVSAIRKKRW